MRSSTTPMNNSELRKMSNPIPINIINNVWQMRSPQSFANIDDSTQFDPGIMPDQCISQSSISPSSASYSLSPTQAIYNSNMYQQQMINNNMITNQTYNNNNNILTVNFDTFNNLDLVVSSNQSNQNIITNSGFNTNNTNLTDSFVNLDESNSSTNNIAIDLESLLVNTTLSDSSNNILLHHHHQHADEDPNSEENININNNINPMFLFNNNYKTNQFSSNIIDLNNNNTNTNESNKIKHILQKQNEKKYLTQSPSPPLSSSSSSSSNSTSSSTTFNQQFNNNNANLRQRKIVEEEEEEGEETSAQQFNQYQYSDVNLQQQIINAPMSLPATSFLDSNSFRFINSPSLINNTNHNNSYQQYDSFNNSKQQQQQMSPLADPVLTQIQMNNSKCKQTNNNNYLVYNAQKQNRKVNFLIQENQTKQQQQQQQYFNPNQFLNVSNAAVNLPSNNNNVYIQQQQQQHHNSISLPVYSSIFDYINNNKQTDESKKNEMLNSNKSDEIKFSKLKISSPASSTSSSSSNNNNSSSSSASSTAQQYLNIKTEAKVDDSVCIDSTTSLLFSNDVINVNSNSFNNNNSQQQRQQDDENAYFNDFNQIVLNFNNNEQHNIQGSKMDQLDVNSLVNDQDHSWHDLNTIQVDQNLDDSLNLEVEDDNKNNEKEQIQMHRLIAQNHQQQQQHDLLAEFEDEESGDEDDEDEYDDDEDEDDEDEDYDDEEDDDEDEEEDVNDEDSNFGIQFGDAADFGTNTSRRRSNRVKSNTNISSSTSLNKMVKTNSQQIIKRRQLAANSSNLASSFNATPSIMFANQQQKQQLFVGSVGSSLTMMRRSNASRKHARTTVNSSGVDVHTSNSQQQQQQQQQVQHMTSSNTKNLFSNLQFSPFSSNATSANYPNMNQQQNMVSNQQPLTSNMQFQPQSQQSFLSTSLPASHTLDSMMLILNKNNQVQQQPQQAGLQFKQQNNLYNLVENKTHNQQHPNLNKLLLNNNTTIQQLTPKLPTTNAADMSKKRQPKSVQPKPQKKRQQKKQDLDEDEEDLDSEDSEDDELPSDDENLMKTSIKMEESDYDSDSTELNMSTKSKGKGTSASSSYANHESLFDLMMSSKNRDAYFWQYNIQSKGPKTKKVLTLRNKDPHLHRDFFDPVYQLQALNRVNGSAAVNKLRKGDGNDVTPNTEKLYNLGNQIRDFIQKSYQMNSACFSPPPHSSISSSLNQLGTTPTNNNLLLSSSVDTAFVTGSQPPRVNLKREKNKIASRACRLKKKAQHEANKIKLSGLNEEHKQLIDSINSARELIRTRLTNPEKLPADKKMIELIDDQIKKKLRTKVAGNSDGYVHSLMLVVEKEKTKQNKGGLYDLSSQQSFAAQQQQPQTIKIEQIQHHYNIYNTNEAI